MRRLLAMMVLPRTLVASAQQRAFLLVCAATLSTSTRHPSGRSRKLRVAAAGRDMAGPPAEAHGSPVTETAAEPEAQQRQQQLRLLETALARHNELYYNQQRPEISDAAYDDLKRQYRQLAGKLRGEAPEEVQLPVGAPVQGASGGLRKAVHPAPMLSLAAVESREQTAAWLEKTLAKLAAAVAGGGAAVEAAGRSRRSGRGKARGRSGAKSRGAAASAAAAAEAVGTAAEALGPYRWVVEPKVDGLAVRALYHRTADGTYELEEAATRGDGAVGEDVTHNALHGAIQGLPRSLRLAGMPSWSNGGGGGAAVGGGSGTAPPQPLPPPASSSAATPTAPAARGPGPEWVDVRGEVFVHTADLQLVNAAQEAAGQPPFANTRNAASGAVRLLDPSECRRRRLSFVAYAALAPKPPPLTAPPPSASAAPPPAPSGRLRAGGDGGDGDGGEQAGAGVGPLHDSHWQTLQWLEAAGFAVSRDNRLCDSAAGALAAAEQWMARRGTLGYDADGVVLKLDDTSLYDTLGTSGSDPRWAVAWKFPAGEAVTRLAGVELSVGRQGQITPVALLEPVELGGVTIRRASLHNIGLATGLGLHMGDAVVLRRSGDVIPQVLRTLPELRPPGAAPWRPPSSCPACGGPLRLLPAVAPGAGDQLLCDSPGCEAKSERRLLHFAGVCLKGSGVSRGVVSQLFAAGLITDLPDFYALTEASLLALPGLGPARVSALAAALASSRAMPVSALLRGLNIRLVGETAAAALGAAFPSLDQLAAASAERIQQAAGVGPGVARSVAEWFQRPTNRELVGRLRDAGLQCIAGSAPVPEAAPNEAAAASGTSRGTRRPRVAAASASAASSKARQGERGGEDEEEEGERATSAEAAGGRPMVRSRGAGGPGLVGVAGLTVCVTGTLQGPHGSGMPRNDLQRMLEDAGAEFHRGIKRDTQVLLVGADAGSKKPRDAAARGVRVLSEPQFWSTFWSGDPSGPEP